MMDNTATEELWRLAKRIMAYATCEDCAECDLLRAIARSVLDIKKELRSD